MAEVLAAPPSLWGKLAFRSGILYAIAMAIVLSFLSGSIKTGIVSGAISGIFFGIVFAALMRWFASRQTRRFAESPPDLGGEEVIVEGPANLLRGVEGVGGYLWLTGRRLYFKPHRMNLQREDLTLSLASLAGVETSIKAGPKDTGLLLRSSSGEEHRFVVNHNDRWRSAILDTASLPG